MKAERPVTTLSKKSRKTLIGIVVKKVRSGQIQDIFSK